MISPLLSSLQLAIAEKLTSAIIVQALNGAKLTLLGGPRAKLDLRKRNFYRGVFDLLHV